MRAAAQMHSIARALAADMADPGLAEYLHAQLPGQVQVVEIQAVLRPLRTAADAATTAVAAAALWAAPGEIRVGQRLRRAEVDALRHGRITLRHAECRGRALQPVVLLPLVGIVGHAEHLPGAPIVRCQAGLPVVQRRPGRIAVERRLRLQQHGGIDQAATTDADAVDHPDIAIDLLRQRPAQPQRGRPQQVPHRLPGTPQIGRAVLTALFQHGHPVAFLGQAQGADAATETGADDQHIEVAAHASRTSRKGKPSRRRPGRSTKVRHRQCCGSSWRSSSRTQRQGLRVAWP